MGSVRRQPYFYCSDPQKYLHQTNTTDSDSFLFHFNSCLCHVTGHNDNELIRCVISQLLKKSDATHSCLLSLEDKSGDVPSRWSRSSLAALCVSPSVNLWPSGQMWSWRRASWKTEQERQLRGSRKPREENDSRTNLLKCSSKCGSASSRDGWYMG